MKKIILPILIIIISIFILTIKFTGLVSYSNVETCIDSDLGFNFKEKGVITGEYLDGDEMKSIYYSQTDYCENGNTLIEYYCIKGGIASKKAYKKYQCEDSCLQGICINGKAREILFISPILIIILIILLSIFFIYLKQKKKDLKIRHN